MRVIITSASSSPLHSSLCHFYYIFASSSISSLSQATARSQVITRNRIALVWLLRAQRITQQHANKKRIFLSCRCAVYLSQNVQSCDEIQGTFSYVSVFNRNNFLSAARSHYSYEKIIFIAIWAIAKVHVVASCWSRVYFYFFPGILCEQMFRFSCEAPLLDKQSTLNRFLAHLTMPSSSASWNVFFFAFAERWAEAND